jgi:hypothetical protein
MCGWFKTNNQLRQEIKLKDQAIKLRDQEIEILNKAKLDEIITKGLRQISCNSNPLLIVGLGVAAYWFYENVIKN